MIRASTEYYLVTTTRDTEATGSINVKAAGPITTGSNRIGKNDTIMERMKKSS